MAYTPYEQQAFQTRYSLTGAPIAAGAYVLHLITTQYSADGNEWTDDRPVTVAVPAADLEAVLVLSDGGAKVQAYKDMLKANRNTVISPDLSVADGAIQGRANALAQAKAAAVGAAEYIASITEGYPVNFSY